MSNQTGNNQWRRLFRSAIYGVTIFLAAQIGLAQKGPKGSDPLKRPAFHPHRLLVKPNPDVAGAKGKIAALHSAHGGKILKSFKNIGDLQVIEFPPGVEIERMEDIYSHDPSVQYAELDYEVHVSATPNDPQYLNGALWGWNNTGQSGGIANADIDAPEGWSLRTQATNVIVAVIDTGVRYTHQDLEANMWTNPLEIPSNGIDDDGNGIIDDIRGFNAITMTGDPMDDHGHGTHVAGTIGAVGNNGIGVVGVAWNAKIMACKFLNSFGSGWDSDAVSCVNYATEHGATVMNNSWGGGGYVQALSDAIEVARQHNVIFVAAAGNNSSDNDISTFYPSSYNRDNIVVVAATTRTDDLAYFSNFGQGSVDVAAPGLSIISTWNTSDSDYNTISGTSMATPAVSGLVALMKAQFPNDNYQQTLNRIYSSTDPLTVLSNKCRTGGRINLAKSLGSTSSAPGNDSFTNRRSLSGASWTIKGINVDASKQTGEPNHAGNAGGHSIWWSWRPISAAVATIQTRNNNFDTLLGVYTGSSVSNLTLLASNDNDPAGGNSSIVTLNVEAGTDYQIAVDGASGATGSTTVNVSTMLRPPNDLFANRISITGSLTTVTGSNNLATAETGEPTHANLLGGHSVWWTWTATFSQTVAMSTLGSSFDTTLAVYTGSSVSDLTPIASNDNDPAGGTSSMVLFNAVAGTTYQIAVDGRNGATGNVTLQAPL